VFRIIISYFFTDKWLSLSWDERKSINEKVIEPLVEKYDGQLDLELVDAEAFDPELTDFVLIKTNDLIKYYYFIEHLRESELVTKNYLKIQKIQIGVIGGFKRFESEVLNEEAM